MIASGKRGPKGLHHDTIIAIYNADGMQKAIAHDFGVSPTLVCLIKSGKKYAHVTEIPALNAALISMACGAA